MYFSQYLSVKLGLFVASRRRTSSSPISSILRLQTVLLDCDEVSDHLQVIFSLNVSEVYVMTEFLLKLMGLEIKGD
jgi:hypothetical protein